MHLVRRDRRTTRRLLSVAAAGVTSLGLAACGGGDSAAAWTPSSSTGATSRNAPSTGAGSLLSTPAAATAFRVGQCYDDTTDWRLTPCSATHKLEITAVVPTTQFAHDSVRRGVLRTWTCNNAVAPYVGSASAAFSRILGQPVPTAVDAGSNTHIVCAAAVAKPDDSGYQEIGYRLRDRIEHTGYVGYRICTSDRPSTTDSPHIVPCDRAHEAETVGGYVIGRADGRYPGETAVDKEALGKCVPLAEAYLGAARGDVIASANSTGPTGWRQGTTMTACFVEATKGTFVKPLKGLKNAPLSRFQ